METSRDRARGNGACRENGLRSPRAYPVGDHSRTRQEQTIFACGHDHIRIAGVAVTPDQRRMARDVDPVSARGFELRSNQPGMRFSSCSFFDATVTGKRGPAYRIGDASVMEPQVRTR